jgi:multiple sugar transport system substrate-binding protein
MAHKERGFQMPILKRPLKTLAALFVVGLSVALGVAHAQEVNLRLATWQWEADGYTDFWQESVADFMNDNPSIAIEPFAFPTAQLWDRLNTQIAAGTPPDIIELTGFNVFQYANEGVLAPLDECLAGTGIVDSLTVGQDYAVIDGARYALPLSARTRQFFVNTQMFDEAGIDIPTSFNELREAAIALTNTAEDEFGLVLVNLPHPRMYEFLLVMVAGYGGHFSQNGQPAFTSPEVIQGITFFKDLFDAGAMPAGVANGGAQYSYFNSGRVALTSDGPWYWATLEDAAPELVPHIEIIPNPTDTQTPTGGVNNMIGIAAASDHYEEACAYIRSIATPEWGQKWTNDSGTAYAIEGSVSQEFIDANPWFQTFAEELARAVPLAPPGLEVYYNDIVRMVNDSVVEVLYDDRPVEEAMAELQAEVEEFIADMQ